MAIDDRAREMASIREEFSGPVPASTRNINPDVHLGHALQRPYAGAEDRMVPLRTAGFGSYDDLKVALAKMPGSGNDIEQRADGLWVRFVPRIAETEYDPQTGRAVAYYEEMVPRVVALSRADAKRLTETGIEADAWEGGTWWRRGQKPERDFAVQNHQDGRTTLRRVELNERGQPKDDGARRRMVRASEPGPAAGAKKED